jgi:hypothetical protein
MLCCGSAVRSGAAERVRGGVWGRKQAGMAPCTRDRRCGCKHDIAPCSCCTRLTSSGKCTSRWQRSHKPPSAPKTSCSPPPGSRASSTTTDCAPRPSRASDSSSAEKADTGPVCTCRLVARSAALLPAPAPAPLAAAAVVARAPLLLLHTRAANTTAQRRSHACYNCSTAGRNTGSTTQTHPNALLQKAARPAGGSPKCISADEQCSTVRVACSDAAVLLLLLLLLLLAALQLHLHGLPAVLLPHDGKATLLPPRRRQQPAAADVSEGGAACQRSWWRRPSSAVTHSCRRCVAGARGLHRRSVRCIAGGGCGDSTLPLCAHTLTAHDCECAFLCVCVCVCV